MVLQFDISRAVEVRSTLLPFSGSSTTETGSLEFANPGRGCFGPVGNVCPLLTVYPLRGGDTVREVSDLNHCCASFPLLISAESKVMVSYAVPSAQYLIARKHAIRARVPPRRTSHVSSHHAHTWGYPSHVRLGLREAMSTTGRAESMQRYIFCLHSQTRHLRGSPQ
jgi:hypothetical protein